MYDAEKNMVRMQLMVIGGKEVGKYYYVERIINDSNPSRKPRNGIGAGIGFSIYQTKLGKKLLNIFFWEFSALKSMNRFRTQTGKLLKRLHGIIFLYDITKMNSFINIEKHLQEILSQKPNLVCCLIGNKIDLVEEREIAWETGYNLAAEYNIPFIEISLKSNINVLEAHQLIINDICYLYEIIPNDLKQINYLANMLNSKY